MRVAVDGTKTTSRQLGKLHDRLSSDQQRWVLSQILDDMYAIQRMWWRKEFGGKQDKERRSDNPPRYMFQSGGLYRGATTRRGTFSFNKVTDKFALLSVKGSAVGLAESHRRRGRDVIADISRRDQRDIQETMGRFIFAAGGS